MKIRDIMTTNVTSVRTDSSIREVANQMKSLNVGSMPVCDGSNTPVGIVTDRDIVLRNVSQGKDVNEQVGNIMSSGLVSVSPDTDIHEAAEIMAQNQIRRLPVVENGRLVGIVSIGDLAVRDIYINEAGDALSSISEPSNQLR
ncbi:Signal-transduction protein [Caldisalinibacter kiritimatiensis]|uniref:Signal-transduction protein n=1 Tax=Caldisalinibacter kiritimatiensis TaxID=1304284 RepID=R1AY62_9FIRM|nr:CBS domain-containing protein [Caldisalinibacter kiritimatiensis]EOD01607.1 Signal-transduction protein [Caldisalinibacter kiritimatiensis]